MARVQVDVTKNALVVTSEEGTTTRMPGTTWDWGSMVVRPR